jgi:hypothetical protein
VVEDYIGYFKNYTVIFQSFICDLVRFFETVEATVPSSETVAVITIIEHALIAAKQPYQWIKFQKDSKQRDKSKAAIFGKIGMSLNLRKDRISVPSRS